MGVWIETIQQTFAHAATVVTPFVGVWIETSPGGEPTPPPRSHPSWVCGLKLINHDRCDINVPSHPSWVCGLKQMYERYIIECHVSHPSWVCGLKQPYQ